MSNNNIYNFWFSEMKISLKTKWLVYITDNFTPFYIQENAQKEQCLFECVVCDELENIQGTKVYSGLEYDVIRRRDNRIYVCLRITKKVIGYMQFHSRCRKVGRLLFPS